MPRTDRALAGACEVRALQQVALGSLLVLRGPSCLLPALLLLGFSESPGTGMHGDTGLRRSAPPALMLVTRQVSASPNANQNERFVPGKYNLAS